MPEPSPRHRRRQLSRSIPWHLPVALLFLLGALLFALAQPLRGRLRGGGEAIVQGDAAIPPVPTTSVVAADPLDDPAIRPSELDNADRINLLLLGTDGRDEQDGPPRTDLMMLVLLDRTRPRATVISLPRDLWVPIPGYGEGKINTAFFLGAMEERGPELAQETVEALIGLPIHHTVQIDFEGFRTLIDEMGGIIINVPEAIDDPQYPDGNYGTLHLEIPAGVQTMDGETALRYARTRFGGLDMDRSARQQQVIHAIRDRALEPAQLAQAPFRLRTAYRVVETDMSLSDFFALARFGRSLAREDIAMHTINGDLTWPVLTWNGQDALLYDPADLRTTIQAWSRGEEASGGATGE